MTKEELREKRNRTIESLNDIKAILGLDKLYIDELEKENAELKEAIKHLNPCGEWNDDVHDCEFRHYAMEYGSQLIKAKELLKRCYDTYVYEVSVRREIEQFLKEVSE